MGGGARQGHRRGGARSATRQWNRAEHRSGCSRASGAGSDADWGNDRDGGGEYRSKAVTVFGSRKLLRSAPRLSFSRAHSVNKVSNSVQTQQAWLLTFVIASEPSCSQRLPAALPPQGRRGGPGTALDPWHALASALSRLTRPRGHKS